MKTNIASGKLLLFTTQVGKLIFYVDLSCTSWGSHPQVSFCLFVRSLILSCCSLICWVLTSALVDSDASNLACNLFTLHRDSLLTFVQGKTKGTAPTFNEHLCPVRLGLKLVGKKCLEQQNLFPTVAK